VTAEPLPPRAPAGPAVGVPWLADDGTAFEVVVHAADLDTFLARRTAWLDAERARIRTTVEQLAEVEANAVFVRLIERVPRFTDWVYGWVESYFAAYLIAERAIEQLIFGDEKGNSVAMSDAVAGGFRHVVSEKFEQIVLRPVGPQAALAANWDRLVNEVQREWRGVLARDRELWDEFLFASSKVGRKPDPEVPGAPICAVATGLDRLSLDPERLRERLDPEQADLFALRFARPYAARVTIIGLRFAGLGPTLGTAGASGAFGVGVGAAGSVALISAAVSTAIWVLDYAINVVDEALYRSEFESRVVGALMTAERLEAEESGSRAAAVIDDAITALSRCGAPPVVAALGPSTL